MNNAQIYFNQQKQNPELIETYSQISELEKLQSFIHQSIFLPSQTKMSV